MKKFYFKKNDDIYKIFYVIDKLPKNIKKVIFDIDANNSFFDNKWWLKLVMDKSKGKGVDVKFVIENQKQENLLKSMNLDYVWRKVPLHKKIRNHLFNFLDLFKSEHSFYKRHYNIFKILLLLFEVGLVIFGIYFVYNLVTPKTDVYIQPATRIKTIVQKIYIYSGDKHKVQSSNRNIMKYNSNVFTKTYSLKIPVKDISYIAKPAHGKIKIINTTYQDFSLKAYTRFITSDGMIFRLKNWVYVPEKKDENKNGEVMAEVVAESFDRNGLIIGERGNLMVGTKLYIKNMYLSFGRKKIYAEVVKNFEGGETNSKGVVSLQDINILKKQLLNTLNKQYKLDIHKYIQSMGNKHIFLDYKKLYGYKNIVYKVYQSPGDKSAYVLGDIQADIYYSYIDKSKLKGFFKNYLKDRIISENEFLGFDDNSIEITSIDAITDNVYKIIVSVNALLGYDFDTDYNYILPKIKKEIKGKTVEKAKKIILSYPMVGAVEIKTTNTINKVSDLNSRIFIHITE